jgi:hypothetical protein
MNALPQKHLGTVVVLETLFFYKLIGKWGIQHRRPRKCRNRLSQLQEPMVLSRSLKLNLTIVEIDCPNRIVEKVYASSVLKLELTIDDLDMV